MMMKKIFMKQKQMNYNFLNANYLGQLYLDYKNYFDILFENINPQGKSLLIVPSKNNRGLSNVLNTRYCCDAVCVSSCSIKNTFYKNILHPGELKKTEGSYLFETKRGKEFEDRRGWAFLTKADFLVYGWDHSDVIEFHIIHLRSILPWITEKYESLGKIIMNDNSEFTLVPIDHVQKTQRVFILFMDKKTKKITKALNTKV